MLCFTKDKFIIGDNITVIFLVTQCGSISLIFAKEHQFEFLTQFRERSHGGRDKYAEQKAQKRKRKQSGKTLRQQIGVRVCLENIRL